MSFYYRATHCMQPRYMLRHSVCLFVCLSFKLVDCLNLKTAKRIIKICHNDSSIVIVFQHQTSWQHSNGINFNEGIK